MLICTNDLETHCKLLSFENEVVNKYNETIPKEKKKKNVS